MSNINRIFKAIRRMNARKGVRQARRQVKRAAVAVARQYPNFHRF